MGLFSSKPIFCGLDLGNTRLRLVQLSPDAKKRQLVAVGSLDILPGLFWQEEGTPDQDKQAVQLIKKLVKQVGLKTDQVVVSLPEDEVFSRVIEMPQMSRAELDSNIRYEAENYIPYAVDNAEISWDLLNFEKPPVEKKKGKAAPSAAEPTPPAPTIPGSPSNSVGAPPPPGAPLQANVPTLPTSPVAAAGAPPSTEAPSTIPPGGAPSPILPSPSQNNTLPGIGALDEEENDTSPQSDNLKVLLTAAETKRLQRTVDLLAQAGLKVLAVETNALASARSLTQEGFGPCRAILDIGHFKSQLIITWQGAPLLNKSIAIGSLQLTQAIAKELSLKLPDAEKLKLGLSRLQPEQQQSVIKAYAPTLQAITSDVKRTVNFFQQQPGNQEVTEVILTGRGAELFGMNTFLQNALSRTVTIGNPWQPVDGSKGEDDNLGSEYAVAVGLAMRPA